MSVGPSQSPMPFAEMLDSVSLPGSSMQVTKLSEEHETDELSENEELRRVSGVDLEILRATLNNLSAAVEEHFLEANSKVLKHSDLVIAQSIASYKQRFEEEKTRNERLSAELTKVKAQLCEEKQKNADLLREYKESTERMATQQQTNTSLVEYRFAKERKQFLKRYAESVIIPQKKTQRFREAFWKWRVKYLREFKVANDSVWQRRLERTTKQVITTYEEHLCDLRSQLTDTKQRSRRLEAQQSAVAQNMKRAFMRSVAQLNMEAMSLTETQIKDMLKTTPETADVKSAEIDTVSIDDTPLSPSAQMRLFNPF